MSTLWIAIFNLLFVFVNAGDGEFNVFRPYFELYYGTQEKAPQSA